MAYLKVDGGELYYEDVGKGPAIVLVHGTTGNSDHWDQQIQAFVNGGYRCVRFDTRGYGRSRIELSKEAVGSIADDIEQVRAALGLGRIFVIGQSNGAEGAIDYALDFPQNVQAIVAATSWRTGDSEPSHVALRDKLVPETVRMRPRVELQLGATYRATNPDGVRRFMAIDQANGRPTPTPGVRAGQERRQPSTYARLAKMTVPTLVVAADEDILTPIPLMRTLADHIPGSEFVIVPKAGRYSFWENPEAFNKAVLDFFGRVRSRRAGLDLDVGVKQGYAQVSGASLYYEDAGASYRSVVFVHDAGATSEGWSQQVPAFVAAGYRCIRFDGRGSGRSRTQPGFEAAGSAAEDLGALADVLGLGSFFLMGAGQGAIEAVDFALNAPDRVRGLAVSNPPAPLRSLGALRAPTLSLSEASQAADWSTAVIAFLDRQA